MESESIKIVCEEFYDYVRKDVLTYNEICFSSFKLIELCTRNDEDTAYIYFKHERYIWNGRKYKKYSRKTVSHQFRFRN